MPRIACRPFATTTRMPGTIARPWTGPMRRSMRTGIMTDNHRPIERPIELPDDDPLPGSGGMFDLPEDVGPPTSPALPGPCFERPPDDGPAPRALAAAGATP